MMNIYYNDGVQPSTCVHACSTLEEAKKWIREQLMGKTVVDALYPNMDDVYRSSKFALYQVFDGEPITIGEDGKPNLAEPIYESDYFCVDHYAFE